MPSLDLYREPDPFRVPHLREFRDLIDVEEFLTMCTAGFPEPKTFGSRIARLMKDRAGDFDIAHDNQVLGHGILELEELGLPVIATIHHPITMDRRIDLQTAPDLAQAAQSLRRWYGFLRMQTKVARRLRTILTPSDSSRRDIARDFGVDPDADADDPARRRRRLRAADRAARARPDPRDGQRRRPDEGHRDAAGGLRQAAASSATSRWCW